MHFRSPGERLKNSEERLVIWVKPLVIATFWVLFIIPDSAVTHEYAILWFPTNHNYIMRHNAIISHNQCTFKWGADCGHDFATESDVVTHNRAFRPWWLVTCSDPVWPLVPCDSLQRSLVRLMNRHLIAKDSCCLIPCDLAWPPWPLMTSSDAIKQHPQTGDDSDF